MKQRMSASLSHNWWDANCTCVPSSYQPPLQLGGMTPPTTIIPSIFNFIDHNYDIIDQGGDTPIDAVTAATTLVQHSQTVKIQYCDAVSKIDGQDFLTLVTALDYGVNGSVTPLLSMSLVPRPPSEGGLGTRLDNIIANHLGNSSSNGLIQLLFTQPGGLVYPHGATESLQGANTEASLSGVGLLQVGAYFGVRPTLLLHLLPNEVH